MQAKDLMGKWNVKALFVADKSVPIGTPCDYALDFGGSLTYSMRDNGVRKDLRETGSWSFDESNSQLVLQFKGEDGHDMPGGRYVCQVTEAGSKSLKFTYADVNGIISRVELDPVT